MITSNLSQVKDKQKNTSGKGVGTRRTVYKLAPICQRTRLYRGAEEVTGTLSWLFDLPVSKTRSPVYASAGIRDRNSSPPTPQVNHECFTNRLSYNDISIKNQGQAT
jgi:hypothetical protein